MTPHSHPIEIRLVECTTMKILDGPLRDWRLYWIMYGEKECDCPEGIIFLPKHVDPNIAETLLSAACAICKLCGSVQPGDKGVEDRRPCGTCEPEEIWR